LPYCFSICSIANSIAFSFSVVIVQAIISRYYNPFKGKIASGPFWRKNLSGVAIVTKRQSS
jgi:hypothetical protein